MVSGSDSVDPQEWRDLIVEFEQRSASARKPAAREELGAGIDVSPLAVFNTEARPARPEGRILGRENPDQYASLNQVETAMMTAITALLWLVGRVFQLDSFIILFYPLPSLIVMMRWGPRYGNYMFVTTCVMIFTLMGPYFGLQYMLSTGLLVVAFGNTMWHQCSWVVTIAAGCFAKFIGVVANITWTSAILRYNTWTLLSEQVSGTIDRIGAIFAKYVGGGATFSGPTAGQVSFGIGVIIALHSLFHVLFTHLSVTMILDRLHDKGVTKRSAKMVPFLLKLKAMARKSLDDVENDPFQKLK